MSTTSRLSNSHRIVILWVTKCGKDSCERHQRPLYLQQQWLRSWPRSKIIFPRATVKDIYTRFNSYPQATIEAGLQSELLSPNRNLLGIFWFLKMRYSVFFTFYTNGQISLEHFLYIHIIASSQFPPTKFTCKALVRPGTITEDICPKCQALELNPNGYKLFNHTAIPVFYNVRESWLPF